MKCHPPKCSPLIPGVFKAVEADVPGFQWRYIFDMCKLLIQKTITTIHQTLVRNWNKLELKEKLQYSLSLSITIITRLNDLVATGPESFYASNDGCLRSPTTRERIIAVEMLALWNCGSVVYYDGTAGRIVKDGLMFPNGIQISTDGKYVKDWETGSCLPLF